MSCALARVTTSELKPRLFKVPFSANYYAECLPRFTTCGRSLRVGVINGSDIITLTDGTVITLVGFDQKVF